MARRGFLGTEERNAETVSFGVPAELYDALAREMQATEMNMSEVCRALLKKGLEMGGEGGSVKKYIEARRSAHKAV